METSLATILEPASQLINLLFIPRIIYFCAFFAYDGLKNGISLTHVGMRQGVIARVYGVFYLLICLVYLLSIPGDIKKFMTINPSDIQHALFFATPLPEMGFIFIGLSLLLFLFVEWLIRFGQKKKPNTAKIARRIQSARKFLNWMILLPLAVGIQNLLGLPEWVYVGIFAVYIYFSPLTSPREIKKVVIVPDEKKNSIKSVPNTEKPG